MTHSHASRQPTGQPAGRSHRAGSSAGPAPDRPVALPGLAVPSSAVPGGSPVIRRQKADAVRYAKDNGINIVVSKSTVEDYVTDTDNDKDLRKGLLDAWNLNASSQWAIDTPADLAKGSDNPFHYSNFTEYQNFTKTTSGVSIQAFGGPISAYYNRGAPKLGSASKNWGNTDLGDTYVSFIKGLRSGGQTDSAIAQALLDLDDSVLASHLEKRAAAMMTITVYLAEEWRKQGAAKIYRAILRLIAQGKKTFDDFLDDFKFVGSAQDGRQQVARFYDVWLGDSNQSDMDSDEDEIYEALSQQRNEDFSSDDEMRTEDQKNLQTTTRLLAKKHKKKTK